MSVIPAFKTKGQEGQKANCGGSKVAQEVKGLAPKSDNLTLALDPSQVKVGEENQPHTAVLCPPHTHGGTYHSPQLIHAHTNLLVKF